MAIRQVLLFPDRRLRVVSKPIECVDGAVRGLLDDLAETMYAEPGIGLAAPQIGVPLRAFVIDLKSPEGGDLRAFVNPRLVVTEGEVVWKEGCLSFPGITDEVTRFARVTIEALDRDGRPFTLEAEGLPAVAVQHEYDHLEGRLLVDHVSFLKKRLIRREMARINAERGGTAREAG